MCNKLGSLLTLSKSLLPEITRRTQACNAKLRQIRTNVVRNPAIALRKRVNVAKYYLHTKAIFHSGTWGAVNSMEFKEFHPAIMTNYRTLLGLDTPTRARSIRMTGDEAINELEVGAPLSIVFAARIDTFGRIIARQQHIFMLALSNAASVKNRWISTIPENLHHLADLSDK